MERKLKTFWPKEVLIPANTISGTPPLPKGAPAWLFNEKTTK